MFISTVQNIVNRGCIWIIAERRLKVLVVRHVLPGIEGGAAAFREAVLIVVLVSEPNVRAEGFTQIGIRAMYPKD